MNLKGPPSSPATMGQLAEFSRWVHFRTHAFTVAAAEHEQKVLQLIDEGSGARGGGR